MLLGVLLMYATLIADRLEHLRTVEIQDFDNFDVGNHITTLLSLVHLNNVHK